MEIPAIYQTIIGVVAGTLTAVSMLPQLIKLIKEKQADDISIPMLFVLMSGLATWIFYGTLIQDVAVIATNSLSLCINLLVTVFTFKYKKK